MGRKPIQITSTPCQSGVLTIILCDDGTIWEMLNYQTEWTRVEVKFPAEPSDD